MLSIALALRGDAVDVLPLAREAFDQLRGLGATSGAVLAAALHHARRDDLRRAVLLGGYALSPQKTNPAPVCLPVLLQVHHRVRDRALVEYSAAAIDIWLHAGEGLTEAQVAAIAFDDAPLDGLP
jgi:predicted esterase